MGDFKSASTWMKLAMFMISLAFSMHLFSMDAAGYGSATCGRGWSDGNNGKGNDEKDDKDDKDDKGHGGHCDANRAIQAMMIIGFLTILTALFLVLCLVLLDELKGNKIALICAVVFSLIGGLVVIVGVAIYEGYPVGEAPLSSSVAVMAGLSALLCGVFGILELVGVSPPPIKG